MSTVMLLDDGSMGQWLRHSIGVGVGDSDDDDDGAIGA